MKKSHAKRGRPKKEELSQREQDLIIDTMRLERKYDALKAFISHYELGDMLLEFLVDVYERDDDE